MQTQADKSPYLHRAGAARGILPLLITGIAVALFSAAGIARMMGWGTNSPGTLVLDQTALVSETSEASAKPRCAECGVIVSMREIERRDDDSGPGVAGGVTAGNRYEFIVRMADGSSRVIEDANPESWRTGERVIVIGSGKPPSR